MFGKSLLIGECYCEVLILLGIDCLVLWIEFLILRNCCVLLEKDGCLGKLLNYDVFFVMVILVIEGLDRRVFDLFWMRGWGWSGVLNNFFVWVEFWREYGIWLEKDRGRCFRKNEIYVKNGGEWGRIR